MGLWSFTMMSLASGIISLLGLQCGTKVGANVNAERGNFHVVRFPEPWLASSSTDNEQIAQSYPEYEVRGSSASADDLGTELFFAGKSPDGSFSKNYYLARLAKSVEISPISKERWEQAKRISVAPQKLFPFTQEEAKQVEYQYRGKKYARSGRSWGDVISSPGEKYLALLSYTGAVEARPILPALGGGEPDRGEIFIDVYDTASGEKVLGGRMPYSGSSPGLLFAHAVWVAERYLVMPLDTSSQSSLVGVLPSPVVRRS